MKHTLLLLALLVVASTAQAQLLPSFGGDRTGTIGFQFLKLPTDPRAISMGQTVGANVYDANALFWNPAMAAQFSESNVALNRTAYFSDTAVNTAAAVIPFGSLRLGFSVQTFDSGEMAVTDEFNQQGTGETFRFLDLAAGVTVAQQLTDLFSYGLTAKYVRESTAGITAQTAVMDLGFFYRVGTTGAQIGVAIRNFGLDAAYEGELSRNIIGGEESTAVEDDFESMSPPTVFLLNVTYDVLRQSPEHRLLVSAQLNNPADNAENFNLAAEYTWRGLLSLRGGYRFGVEEFALPSVGVGLQLPIFNAHARFDYGFTRLERLGNVHSVGLNFGI